MKILRLILYSILILIPFLPITENIFPNQIDPSTFSNYLITCLSISGLMLLLMWIAKRNTSKIGFLLFLLGILVMIPLHLGPPREDESILTASYIEKTRYGFLILAVFAFYSAVYLFLKKHWTTLKISESIILIPLLVSFPILLWDNFRSFMFTEKIKHWIDSGKDSKTFFSEYILSNVIWYATGRILLYISIIGFSVILMHHSFIKKWKGISIGIFGIIGIIFCFIFLSGKPEFYFPFMIPAVVMAPAYWLGLALLSNSFEND